MCSQHRLRCDSGRRATTTDTPLARKTPAEFILLPRTESCRNGNLSGALKPYVTVYSEPKNPETDYVASHGSPWGYDRRVPIVFWWQGITAFEQPTAVETVDIAPTLAKLIGLEIPAHEIDGRALPIVMR